LRLVKTFEELWVELSDKALTRPEGSGTVRELDAGVHAIGKKLVEEAAESWMAAEHESPDRTAEEISQLLYPSPPSDTENMQVSGLIRPVWRVAC